MGSLSTDFRVAIVGGGIGGLVCALSIAHFCPGLKVDVYEQAEQYKEIGAGVGIGVNAAKLLHRFGLGELLNNIVGDRDGIWISFRRGDNGAEILTPLVDDKKTIRQAPCHRAEFLDILQEQVRERDAATLHTRKCLRSVIESGDEVVLDFEDGSTTTANLVIGCDGIHSKVRAQFATDNPRYSGQIAYRGLVPIEKIQSFWPLPSYSAAWLAKDKHFLVFPISQNRTLNIVAFASKRREELNDLRESWTTTTQRAEVEREYKDFDETVRKTIALMPERPGKWLLNDREPLEKWVYLNGKVVLMGDAAHAMLPHQGAGAGQAIEDGYILGRAMKDYLASITTASDLMPNKLAHWMNLYQAVRLPRAQKVQRTSRQAGEIYELQTESMRGKSLDECIPEIQATVRDRMKWIWTDDIDAEYDQMTKSVYYNI